MLRNALPDPFSDPVPPYIIHTPNIAKLREAIERSQLAFCPTSGQGVQVCVSASAHSLVKLTFSTDRRTRRPA